MRWAGSDCSNPLSSSLALVPITLGICPQSQSSSKFGRLPTSISHSITPTLHQSACSTTSAQSGCCTLLVVPGRHVVASRALLEPCKLAIRRMLYSSCDYLSNAQSKSQPLQLCPEGGCAPCLEIPASPKSISFTWPFCTTPLTHCCKPLTHAHLSYLSECNSGSSCSDCDLALYPQHLGQ